MAFSSLPAGGAENVAAEWIARAKEARQRVAAYRLYGGAGWTLSLRGWQAIKMQGGELFIASAGFGLLQSDEIVPPYAATFSVEGDRIAETLCGYNSLGEAHRAWWAAVNRLRSNVSTPMCLSLGGFDRVVAALSSPYFQAVSDDLVALAKKIGPEKLFIVAPGVAVKEIPEILGACLLPISVVVEGVVKGPRATLNQRALVWLLEEVVPRSGWERVAVEAEIRRRLNGIQVTRQLPKQRLSDGEVARWVQQQWAKGLFQGRTVLLRQLRSDGYACEQKRFSEIVAEMEKEKAGQALLDLNR